MLPFYIFYHSYQLGIFPDRMKIAKVIPIYKAGDNTDVNNYRPISVLPCLSKVFEKLLLKRLNSFFEKNDIIRPTNMDFGKNIRQFMLCCIQILVAMMQWTKNFSLA